MFNVTLFPDFTPMQGQSAGDQAFLNALENAKTVSGASYVNFSVYDYDLQFPGIRHVLTWPMDWITRYTRKGYFSHDPFIATDFRRHVTLDWHELFQDQHCQPMYSDLLNSTECSRGLSVVSHLTNNSCSVTSYIYQTDGLGWSAKKRDLLDIHQFYGERLNASFEDVYIRAKPDPAALTGRESQCLYWVAHGKTDDEIAALLHIGKWTVVSHIKHAKEKLAVRNRASAVAVAITRGLISLDEAS